MKGAKGDFYFLIFLGVLLAFGLAILASASSVLSYEDFGNSYGYLEHQFFFGILPGLFIFYFVSKFDYKKIKKLSLFFLVGSIFLLFLVFIPAFGIETKGAARWIQIAPFLPTFQPSELLKLTFILYLGAWLESRSKNISSLSEGLLPFLVICAIIAILLITQPDVGTLIVILLIGAAVYLVAGGKIQHLIYTGFLGLVSLSVLIYSEQYRLKRLLVFLDPNSDPLGSGYQIKQAIIAIGSGGLTGLGLGMSKQKYNYLPEPMGDSIFAITSEEMGFIGATIIIILFALLIWRGFRIAKNSNTEFGRLTAVGITSWIGIQAFMNIGAISGIMPLTGITLPFISYGGSSILFLLTACGILYNISKENPNNRKFFLN